MNNNNYQKDLQDWQEKQYQPGEYTGGKFPPIFKYPSPKLGLLLLIIGTFIIAISIFLLAVGEDLTTSIFGIIMGILLVARGIKK
jgi:hypothetical protein